MHVTEKKLLLSGIPKHYGLKQIPLKYALLGYDGDWLVIGAEVGVLICYHEETSLCFRIPPQGYSKIECIELKERLLVWGTESGCVGVRELRAGSDKDHKQAILKLHGTSVLHVTCNDSWIASADKDGRIALSEINLNKREIVSRRVIHNESVKILSLFFIASQSLLLTTLTKTSILKVEGGSCSVLSVGSKDRKSGEFGACVLDAYTVLVARPGLRLWYASSTGDVLKTIQLRALFKECQLDSSDEDSDKESRLAHFLPKSGIINRVERMDEKLVIVQLQELFVFVETVDLSVVGWLKENVLDWYSSHRILVLLKKDNEIKRYVVTPPETNLIDNGVDSENIVHTSVISYPAHNGLEESVEIVDIVPEIGISESKTDLLGIFTDTLSSELQKGTKIVTPVIPKYTPIPREKIDEITSFVKSVCERDDSAGTINSSQKVSSFETKLTNERSVISHNDLSSSRDASSSLDTLNSSTDISRSSESIFKPSFSNSQASNHISQSGSHTTSQSSNEHNQSSESDNQPCRDVIHSSPDMMLSQSPNIEHSSDSNQSISRVDETAAQKTSATTNLEVGESAGVDNITIDAYEFTTNSDHTLTLNDNTLTSHDHTLTSQDLSARDVTPSSLDVTPNLRDVTHFSRDVTPPRTDTSITVTPPPSEDLEMSITESHSSVSAEKSVMGELKTNLGKKMITSFGLTPSPSKHKQLITSDTTLPLCEPDKISLSSQDTISIHSNSTNCEDDEDRIAVRIRKKKHRIRKEKTSSNDTLDSISSGTSLGTLQEPHASPNHVTAEHLTSDHVTSNHLTVNHVISDHVIDHASYTESGQDVEESSRNFETESIASSTEFDPVRGLDVSSILTGLANLEEGVLRLDDLGLPVVEFDDPYSDGEAEDMDPEVTDKDDKLSSLASTISTTSTILDRKSSSTYSDHNSFPDLLQRRKENLPSCDTDIYSTRSYSESTAELYDLERRPSVEYGEDPLTCEAGSASLPLPRHNVPSPATSPREITSRDMTSRDMTSRDVTSRGKEDSVFLTNDSWLELRGPTMSRMYVTISCLAVSSVSVWCTDNWGNVYFSPNTRGNSLRWERVPGAKLATISVSDSGLIVWGVTSNKRAVVRFGIEKTHLQGTDWSEMMLEAVTVAVDDNSVWLLVSGEKQRLFYRHGVTVEDPQGEKWVPVSTQNLSLTSLSVNNSVVWGVLDSGKLVIRHGISASQPLGNSWHVLSVNNVKRCHVGRDWEVGWVVDSAGIVHFQCGVLPSKPRGSNLWWQVSVSEQLGSNFVTQTVGLFTMRRRTLDVKQVCTSTDGGVWLLSNYNTLHRRYGIITGHNWANISRTFISGKREQWVSISGEGAYPDISGPVWGLTMAGEIVCFTRSSAPRPLDLPTSQGRVVDVAATTNVLWAVDQSGQIHVREGLARDNVMGSNWQNLNMDQLSGVLLHKLSCSDRGVWAVDTTGSPWFRTGCQVGRDTVQAWVKVESNSLKFRDVSAAGSLVWGVDCRNCVYVRTGVTYSLPVGTDWEHVPGLQCLHVRAAQEGVVALSTSQHLVYRHGACPSLPAGNYWRKVPGPPPDGSVSLISTLKGGGVWCQSGRSNQLYRRRVKTVPESGHVTRAPSEDDWEVV